MGSGLPRRDLVPCARPGPQTGTASRRRTAARLPGRGSGVDASYFRSDYGKYNRVSRPSLLYTGIELLAAQFQKAKTGTDSNETATLVIEHGSSKQKKRKAKKKQKSNTNAAQEATAITPPEQTADTATIPVQVTQQPLGSTITPLSAPQNPTQPVRNASRGRGRGRFLVMVVERVVAGSGEPMPNKLVRLMLIV